MSSRFQQAFEYALEKHREQKRKGSSVPYISHLMSVSALVMEACGDEDQAIAGLLHDVPEDQGGRPALEEIRARFGERVAHIVEGCTDTFEEPKPDWKIRKQQYIEHLKHADNDTKLVSLADKLHNARSILADYRQIREEIWKRFKRGRNEQLWYFGALAAAFEASRSQPGIARLLDEFQRVRRDLEQETR